MFATNFGVVPVPVVPLTLTVLAACVLAAANVLAAVPALTAARSRPGQLLRAESAAAQEPGSRRSLPHRWQTLQRNWPKLRRAMAI